MATPTLRTLARTLGLSRTTISDALRGSPRVNAKTAERVRAAAKAAGYESNPLTGTVMSLLRRSRSQEFRGVLAAIEIVDGPQPAHAIRYNERVLAGVSERASALAFKVDRFEISPTGPGLRLSRLDAILQARGIHAMVILPASGFPDLEELDWRRYTAVYIDYLIDHPPLHCVCSDHYHSMISLLQELYRRGYRRPGLFIEITHDERLHFRWEGAFLALQKYLPGITAVPALRLQPVTRGRFEPWFRKYNPDVVLGHVAEAMDWMRACGARIPEAHAFVCLNSLRTDSNCAALDLQASHLGARAAELVIGQLLHNELGVPVEPSLTTISAKLIEGPTLRGPVAAPAPGSPAVPAAP